MVVVCRARGRRAGWVLVGMPEGREREWGRV